MFLKLFRTNICPNTILQSNEEQIIGINFKGSYLNKIRYDSNYNILTNRGLLTPYGDTDLGEHWLR